jgi:hypothetical protein
MNQPILRLLFLVSLCLVAISCTQQINSQPEEQNQLNAKPDTLTKPVNKPRNKQSAERKKIINIIRSECETDQQCKNIGVGHMACGGFAQYLPYSTKVTDVTRLKKQVLVYNRMTKEKNESEGRVGICQHITQPETSCAINQCVNGSNNKAF